MSTKITNKTNVQIKDNNIKDNKNKNQIDEIIAAIEKDYGKGSLTKLGINNRCDQNTIPTGSLTLDIATGIGGYPRGRIIEIYGPEGSGKTTLALHAIAEAQSKGLQAVFIDVEHALNSNYVKNIGVNLSELIIGQPDSGEEALDILETLVKTKMVDLIILDSVAALLPKAELEGNVNDNTIASQARLMSKALRRIKGIVHQYNCLVIFINQVRNKVGIMFGNPEITSGGKALRYYASMRIEIRRTETILNNSQPIGNKVKIKIVKNKMANPFKVAMTEIIFGKGISKYNEVLNLGVQYGVIIKTGIWYNFNDTKLGPGKVKAGEFLNNNEKIYIKIRNQILKCLNLKK